MPDASLPVVTVLGFAELEGPPDLATLSCTVHAKADSVEAVRSQLDIASQRISGVLADVATALHRSGTTGLHVAPVFERRRSTRVDHVAGTFSTEVVVADLGQLASLVQTLTGIENARLDGPWWSLRSDNPLHREARLAAVADARSRAADYAAAFGARVVGLLEVSDVGGGGGWLGHAQDRALMGGPGGDEEPAFDFVPAVQTVSAQVTVRFTLTGVSLDPSRE